MTRMIQIRHVPDHIHRTLKVRAAQAGMTLSDYLRREITAIAERPTLDEVLERIRARTLAHRPLRVTEDSAAAVRAERDARS